MSAFTVNEIPDWKQRAKSLGLQVNGGIAFLPRDFHLATDATLLYHEQSALTLKKVMKGSGLDIEIVSSFDGEVPRIVERSLTWIGPTVLFTAVILAENPDIVSLFFDVVWGHVAEHFKGRLEPKTARMSVIVERSGSKLSRRIDYTGPVEGLKSLPRIIKEAIADES
jgi:hypothetical protein